jgi:hypothetical protein
MKDSVHVGDNSGARAGDINIKVPADNPMPQCPVCYTPLSNDPALNNGLICGHDDCEKRFCEQCESFYRASRERGEMPYCKEHFVKPKDSPPSDPLAAFVSEKGFEPAQDRAPGPPPPGFKSKAVPKGNAVPQRIKMTLLSKGLYATVIPSMLDALSLKCSFTNEFPLEVRAFKGTMRFSDLFHTHIMSVGVTIELKIPRGSSATWPGSLSYNQFMSDHNRLESINLKDLSYELELESVVFSDGSRLP